MEKKNESQLSNFWFGFVFGGMSILTLAYFFGTKNGRKILSDFLHFSENLEENLETLLKKIKENEEKNKQKRGDSPTPLIISLTEKIKNLSQSH